MSLPQRALEGLKVVDVSRYIAGPYAAMLMADHGADVVKVERPGVGEETRHQEPKVRGESLYYMMFNRNKRGLTLDLTQEEGREVLRRLVAGADVLVENFKPGTLETMGCGWEVLRGLNPRLVMARVSGFGQSGPYSRRPCFDPVAQAMGGLMAENGYADGPPLMSGTFIADYGTALYVLSGILMALRHRDLTGEGQYVDCALLDSTLTFLATSIPEYLLLGRSPGRRGNRSRYVAPNECFETRDGQHVYIVGGHPPTFERLARLIGREDLLADLRFSDAVERFRRYDEVVEIVGAWTRSLDIEEVLERLVEAGVPAGRVASVEDLARDPQVRHREMIAEVEHPAVGHVPMQGINIKFSRTPGRIERASPRLGEHSGEVLADWLGIGPEEVEGLRGRNIV